MKNDDLTQTQLDRIEQKLDRLLQLMGQVQPQILPQGPAGSFADRKRKAIEKLKKSGFKL